MPCWVALLLCKLYMLKVIVMPVSCLVTDVAQNLMSKFCSRHIDWHYEAEKASSFSGSRSRIMVRNGYTFNYNFRMRMKCTSTIYLQVCMQMNHNF